MTVITVYYEESMLYSSAGTIKLMRDVDLLNVSESYVLFGAEKYVFVGIRASADHLYLVHETISNTNKRFIFRIKQHTTGSGNDYVDKTEYKEFFNNFNGNSTISDRKKVNALPFRLFISNMIKDKNDVMIHRGGTNVMVDVGKTLVLETNTIPAAGIAFNDYGIGDIGSGFDAKPEDNNSVDKNQIIITSRKQAVIQNCVRKGHYGEKIDYGGKLTDMKDISEKTIETKQALSITALVLFFVIGGGLIVYHLYVKDPDTDILGNRLPEPDYKPEPAVSATGGGSKTGGSCTIPDLGSFHFRLPKPSVIGYFKMSAFLLFLNMMIFGGNPVRKSKIIHLPNLSVEGHTEDRNAFIGVGITILVLSFIVVIANKASQPSISTGMDPVSLLLYSPGCIAVYPAVLGYLIFYTNFIQLAQNKVELPEFMLFMISFMLVSGYAMYASVYNVTSLGSASGLTALVLLVILLVVVGGIMIKDIEEAKKSNRI